MCQKNAEDLLNELELRYLNGFHDCASIVLTYGQGLSADPAKLSKEDQFSLLLRAIENVYSSIASEHDEKVKQILGLTLADRELEQKPESAVPS